MREDFTLPQLHLYPAGDDAKLLATVQDNISPESLPAIECRERMFFIYYYACAAKASSLTIGHLDSSKRVPVD